MKIFKKALLITSLALGSISLSSCSLFFEEGYSITNSSIQKDEETGITKVVISLSGNKSPISFDIPSNIAGKDGVGIKDIVPTINDKEVVLTITFTDPEIAPTIIRIPIINGKDGNGIKEVIVDKNENDEQTFKFVFTDGTESPLVTIPKGENGVGIESIFTKDKGNLIEVTITYTDKTLAPHVFSIPKGIGISQISYSDSLSTADEYCLVITYSDGYVTGKSDSIYLPRPQSNIWHRGTSVPANSLGKNGDFFLNIVTGDVYSKTSNKWSYLFSMKGEKEETVEYATVIFNPNGGNFSGSTTMGVASTILGKTIKISEIPTPSFGNKKFMGWYTTKDFNVNAGKLTDLTPILEKQLQVYAWWE